MLLEILADQAAELDELVDDKLPDIRARISEILFNVDERNPGIWEDYDADIDLLPADFAAVPRADKDKDWRDRLTKIVLASQMQAFVELAARDVLAIAERHGEDANPTAESMSVSELRAAAKSGISKEAVASAAEKRRIAKGGK
jgi:hypothetical protein